jgi:uncharacterized membrane protein YccF (DUF307 family)
VAGIIYTLCVGIPVCLVLCSVGAFLCLTIIGIGPGLTCVALGFKMLTLNPRPRVVVK